MDGANKMKLRIFLFTGLSFAALSQGFDYLQGQGFLPWKFLFNLCFFGGIMTLTLWFTYKKQLRKHEHEISKENLNVYQERILEIEDFSKQKFLERLKTDSYFSKMKIEETENGLKLKSPITWKSWGEIILIERLSEEENAHKIKILSVPALKTTIIDYGKNLQNVENLKRLITTS